MTTSEPYVAAVPLRWSDMDSYGHVNNVIQLRLLEEARVAAFDVWLGDSALFLDAGVVVVHSEIYYRAALRHSTRPARVEMWVSRLDAVRFDIDYRLRDADDAVVSLARTGMAGYDTARGTVRRLTADEQAGLASATAPPLQWPGRRSA